MDQETAFSMTFKFRNQELGNSDFKRVTISAMQFCKKTEPIGRLFEVDHWRFWMRAVLILGLLALPHLGWAQATLGKPAAEDLQCVEQGCTGDPEPPRGASRLTPLRVEEQTGTARHEAESLPDDISPGKE